MTASSITTARTGDRITGTYYGASFTGTIRGLRWHSIDSDRLEIRILTDSPVNVPSGQPRTALLLSVNSNGHDPAGFGTRAELVA